ncbi:MAG TPA: ferrochelatase, partial [Oligoflexia bacterium]|nr:ferrochelatase [Oligoflexia bacterium]
MENEQTTKPKIGVLLVNLGTPEAPETSALRKYLGELLAEPRLVEAPRAVWWLVRHLFILPFRPKRIAALYKEIWMPEGSPLMVYTIKQAAKLAAKLDAAFDGEVSVEVGMCVSSPSVRDALERLQKKGAQGLLILPLFPQYTSSATGA